MADEQYKEELEAQFEDQADTRPLATDEHKALIAYAHSLMNNFNQLDESHIQGLITYKGEYLVATFHQTSIEDLANDSWTLSIEPIEFVGVIDASEEALVGDQILSVEPVDEDSDEDGEDNSSFPF